MKKPSAAERRAGEDDGAKHVVVIVLVRPNTGGESNWGTA